MIVADLARSIAFYERLGLRFPESRDANGTAMSQRRFAAESVFTLDTEESIRSFDRDWTVPAGGHRTTIAFLCDSPEDVDRLYAQLVDAAARATSRPGTPFGVSVTPK